MEAEKLIGQTVPQAELIAIGKPAALQLAEKLARALSGPKFGAWKFAMADASRFAMAEASAEAAADA